MTISRRFRGIGLTVAAVALLGICAARGGSDTKSLEGKPAPDFSFDTIDGKKVSLSQEKGNVVLLDYWATWCPPCRASLPHVQKISADADRAAKGLKVYAINSKEETGAVKEFLEKNNYTFTVPMDAKGEFGKAYLVEGIPTTVIVGRDGVIRNVFIGYGEGSDEPMEKAIDAALKEAK
jgi:peroxiredoxin